ncbi:LysR family transcriptional regulator [Roseovarius sp. SCSIO 43702]|uniref:LysR family transcriptional regulator n=1 Tax=Roseovarius sp. SCSIO 43702 TaxID=2823043 RepID=UPI001C73C0DE|nr:LysR family transcriptional regulator [Roseovarius sp. SCSIO 43702]QYX56233.1 LysR family transcriptional regulator [Roseovarius sp. SCSIO 43702]
MKPIPIALRQIDYVIATADTGSTAAAARLLSVSQPSVSLAIAKVEAHLGRALFVRTAGQGVVPTAFGRLKLGEYRQLRARAELVLLGGEQGREVMDLGVFSTLGPRYAPSLVRQFEEAHPGAQIRLHEGDIEALANWLEGGQIDVALTYDFGLPSTWEVLPLADVRPYGLVPAGHRLEGRSEVGLAELLEDPLILMNLPHSRGYFLTLAQMQGVTPQVAHETGSVEMLRSMVANGMGVGLLATDIPHGTAYDGRAIIRVALAGNLASHRIALVRSKRLQADALTDAFCRYAVEAFADQNAEAVRPPCR